MRREPEEYLKIFNPESGVLLREEYRRNGLLHRNPSEGPAYIAWAGDRIYKQHFMLQGRRHRMNAPAVISANSDFTYEAWFKNGWLHRDPKDGPACTMPDLTTGVVTQEWYFLYGYGYRDPREGPYAITRAFDAAEMLVRRIPESKAAGTTPTAVELARTMKGRSMRPPHFGYLPK